MSTSTARPDAEASGSRKVSFQRSSAAPTRPSIAPSSSGSTSAAIQSAYSGATRRHSLFGTEDRIVLDIGSRYSKFGFSGEPRPRAIVPSVSFSQPSTSFLRSDTTSVSDTLWDIDFEQCTNDQTRRRKRTLLLAQLTQLLRGAFIHHLMVDPKQRKVLVVENPTLPTSVKELILKVLFDNLQVPSVSFVPAPLLSLLAVGRITGLVLDVGYLETTLMPVYYGRPLTSHVVSSTRAGKRLNARLKQWLLMYGKFVAAQTGLQDSTKPLRERTQPIDSAMLTDDRLEQIKVKALFVGSQDPKPSGLQDLFSVLELEGGVDAGSKKEAASSLRQKYSSTSTATPFTFAVSPNSIDPNGTASLIQSINASPSSSASTLAQATNKSQSSGVIVMPGWVRERAAELFFEQGDQDDPSIVDMAVTSISKLPIDLRRVMCENVLVSGGTAMLPGFPNRFRTQLVEAMEKAEGRGGMLSIDRHLYHSRSGRDRKDTSEEGSKLHRSIAVSNDPWPEHDLAGKDKSGGHGGTAPAFAANLLPWMGASLAGALRTTSLNAISREAYDEATKSMQQAAEEAEEGGKRAEEEKDDSKGNDRPKLGAIKRGSFVGVVGGLETGAYGGLAAVSRHLVGIPGSSSGSSAKEASSP